MAVSYRWREERKEVEGEARMDDVTTLTPILRRKMIISIVFKTPMSGQET